MARLNMDSESITVQITNYEKFKGKSRSDVENPTWFRCSNRLLEDADFYKFSFEEICIWVQIMSISSRKKTDVVTLEREHCERACRFNWSSVEAAIEKLRALNILLPGTRVVRRRTAAGTSTSRIQQNITLHTEQNNTDREPTACFASVEKFDEAYSQYKKKVKGAGAFTRYEDQIQSAEDHADLMTALKHYNAMLDLPENDWRKPKQTFAAFLGTKSSGFFWRDFIPPESCLPSTQKASMESWADRMLSEQPDGQMESA